MYWHQALERLETEERDRQAWIDDVKHRLGIRCIGDEEGALEWPALDLPPGASYTVLSDQSMASYDGVNFIVKPEGMTTEEFWASLPKRPGPG